MHAIKIEDMNTSLSESLEKFDEITDDQLDLIDQAERMVDRSSQMVRDALCFINKKGGENCLNGLFSLTAYTSARMELWAIAYGETPFVKESVELLIVNLNNKARDVYAYFACAIQDSAPEKKNKRRRN